MEKQDKLNADLCEEMYDKDDKLESACYRLGEKFTKISKPQRIRLAILNTCLRPTIRSTWTKTLLIKTSTSRIARVLPGHIGKIADSR